MKKRSALLLSVVLLILMFNSVVLGEENPPNVIESDLTEPATGETYVDFETDNFNPDSTVTVPGELPMDEDEADELPIIEAAKQQVQLFSTTSGDFTYDIVDGSATITGYSGLNSVVVPEKLDGYAVTKISTSAFQNNTYITSVILPDIVKSVDNFLFKGCSALETLQLGKSVTYLGVSFIEGTAIKTITIPASVTLFGYRGVNGVYGWQYNNENTYSIGNAANSDGAFSGSNVTAVIFADGRTSIPRTALYECETLQKVVIPASVKSIGIYAFWNCNQLKSIVLPAANIDTYAFAQRYRLVDIWIDYGAETIGDRAFDNCAALEYIYIPKSVTSIGANTFAGHKSYMTIYGTSGSYAEEYATNNGIKFIRFTESSSPFTEIGTYLCQVSYPAVGDTNIPFEKITFTWDAIPKAHLYEISIRATTADNPDSGELILDRDWVTETSYTWTGAKPLTDYKVWVTAYDGVDDTADISRSEARYFKTGSLYGDITGNGEIDNTDVLRLRQYLQYNFDADPNNDISEIVLEASDVTNNGIINNSDVLRLRQYLSYNFDSDPDNDVVLGPIPK